MTQRPRPLLDDVMAKLGAGEFTAAALAGRRLLQQLPQQALPEGDEARVLCLAAAALCEAVEALVAGRYEAGLAGVQAPLALLQASPWRGELAQVFSAIGFAMGKLGDAHSGLPWVRRAAELAKAQGHTAARIKILSDEGCLHGMLLHYTQAISTLTEACALAQRLGTRSVQERCLNNLAYAWMARAGNLQAAGAPRQVQAAALRAEVLAGRALAIATMAGDLGSQAWSRNNRARAWVLQGRLDEALPEMHLALAESQGFHQYTVEIRRSLMDLHRRRQDWAAARAQLAAALALSDEQGYEPMHMVLFEDAALLETQAQRPTEALVWWLRHFQGLQARQRVQRRAVASAAGLYDSQALPHWPPPGNRAAAVGVEHWLDPDTALLNLSGLDAIAQAEFDQGHALAVAVMRVDAAARTVDEPCLLQVARLVAAEWQAGFVAARGLGGTCVLLFPELPTPAVLAICERLRQRVAAAFTEGPGLTVSMGLVVREDESDLASLMPLAVQALQAAVEHGGNCIQMTERQA
jgi:GGDEF domain-containing protein